MNIKLNWISNNWVLIKLTESWIKKLSIITGKISGAESCNVMNKRNENDI